VLNDDLVNPNLVNGVAADPAAQPQGIIPLVNDRNEHYVEIELN